MNSSQLSQAIKSKKSYLCVGLDTDIQRLPQHLLNEKDPIFEFNKAIIDATHDLCVAYKLNTAFYEAEGTKGWESMSKTVEYIGKNHFIIADAKRGDIGNTSSMYAKAFFETIPFDAITVAPYMGSDSIQPFLSYKEKTVIVLGLTSNVGSLDFQYLKCGEKELYLHVMEKVSEWADENQLMFVVGATHEDDLKKVRQRFPTYTFLIPGVGTQGGSIAEVCKATAKRDGNILINNSRAILYASSGKDFDKAARKVALKNQQEMMYFIENT